MELWRLIETTLPAILGLTGVLVGARLSVASNERLARFNYQSELSRVALEKRLEKHQEAFTLWWRLFGSVHSENIQDVVIECQEWWSKNCVYLTPPVANRFQRTYIAAGNHSSLKDVWRDTQSDEDSKKVYENFEFVRSLGREIQMAVGLPGISNDGPNGLSAFDNA